MECAGHVPAKDAVCGGAREAAERDNFPEDTGFSISAANIQAVFNQSSASDIAFEGFRHSPVPVFYESTDSKFFDMKVRCETRSAQDAVLASRLANLSASISTAPGGASVHAQSCSRNISEFCSSSSNNGVLLLRDADSTTTPASESLRRSNSTTCTGSISRLLDTTAEGESLFQLVVPRGGHARSKNRARNIESQSGGDRDPPLTADCNAIRHDESCKGSSSPSPNTRSNSVSSSSSSIRHTRPIRCLQKFAKANASSTSSSTFFAQALLDSIHLEDNKMNETAKVIANGGGSLAIEAVGKLLDERGTANGARAGDDDQSPALAYTSIFVPKNHNTGAYSDEASNNNSNLGNGNNITTLLPLSSASASSSSFSAVASHPSEETENTNNNNISITNKACLSARGALGNDNSNEMSTESKLDGKETMLGRHTSSTYLSSQQERIQEPPMEGESSVPASPPTSYTSSLPPFNKVCGVPVNTTFSGPTRRRSPENNSYQSHRSRRAHHHINIAGGYTDAPTSSQEHSSVASSPMMKTTTRTNSVMSSRSSNHTQHYFVSEQQHQQKQEEEQRSIRVTHSLRQGGVFCSPAEPNDSSSCGKPALLIVEDFTKKKSAFLLSSSPAREESDASVVNQQNSHEHVREERAENGSRRSSSERTSAAAALPALTDSLHASNAMAVSLMGVAPTPHLLRSDDSNANKKSSTLRPDAPPFVVKRASAVSCEHLDRRSQSASHSLFSSSGGSLSPLSPSGAPTIYEPATAASHQALYVSAAGYGRALQQVFCNEGDEVARASSFETHAAMMLPESNVNIITNSLADLLSGHGPAQIVPGPELGITNMDSAHNLPTRALTNTDVNNNSITTCGRLVFADLSNPSGQTGSEVHACVNSGPSGDKEHVSLSVATAEPLPFRLSSKPTTSQHVGHFLVTSSAPPSMNYSPSTSPFASSSSSTAHLQPNASPAQSDRSLQPQASGGEVQGGVADVRAGGFPMMMGMVPTISALSNPMMLIRVDSAHSVYSHSSTEEEALMMRRCSGGGRDACGRGSGLRLAHRMPSNDAFTAVVPVSSAVQSLSGRDRGGSMIFSTMPKMASHLNNDLTHDLLSRRDSGGAAESVGVVANGANNTNCSNTCSSNTNSLATSNGDGSAILLLMGHSQRTNTRTNNTTTPTTACAIDAPAATSVFPPSVLTPPSMCRGLTVSPLYHSGDDHGGSGGGGREGMVHWFEDDEHPLPQFYSSIDSGGEGTKGGSASGPNSRSGSRHQLTVRLSGSTSSDRDETKKRHDGDLAALVTRSSIGSCSNNDSALMKLLTSPPLSCHHDPYLQSNTTKGSDHERLLKPSMGDTCTTKRLSHIELEAVTSSAGQKVNSFRLSSPTRGRGPPPSYADAVGAHSVGSVGVCGSPLSDHCPTSTESQTSTLETRCVSETATTAPLPSEEGKAVGNGAEYTFSIKAGQCGGGGIAPPLGNDPNSNNNYHDGSSNDGNSRGGLQSKCCRSIVVSGSSLPPSPSTSPQPSSVVLSATLSPMEGRLNPPPSSCGHVHNVLSKPSQTSPATPPTIDDNSPYFGGDGYTKTRPPSIVFDSQDDEKEKGTPATDQKAATRSGNHSAAARTTSFIENANVQQEYTVGLPTSTPIAGRVPSRAALKLMGSGSTPPIRSPANATNSASNSNINSKQSNSTSTLATTQASAPSAGSTSSAAPKTTYFSPMWQRTTGMQSPLQQAMAVAAAAATGQSYFNPSTASSSSSPAVANASPLFLSPTALGITNKQIYNEVSPTAGAGGRLFGAMMGRTASLVRGHQRHLGVTSEASSSSRDNLSVSPPSISSPMARQPTTTPHTFQRIISSYERDKMAKLKMLVGESYHYQRGLLERRAEAIMSALGLTLPMSSSAALPPEWLSKAFSEQKKKLAREFKTLHAQIGTMWEDEIRLLDRGVLRYRPTIIGLSTSADVNTTGGENKSEGEQRGAVVSPLPFFRTRSISPSSPAANSSNSNNNNSNNHNNNKTSNHGSGCQSGASTTDNGSIAGVLSSTEVSRSDVDALYEKLRGRFTPLLLWDDLEDVSISYEASVREARARREREAAERLAIIGLRQPPDNMSNRQQTIEIGGGGGGEGSQQHDDFTSPSFSSAHTVMPKGDQTRRMPMLTSIEDRYRRVLGMPPYALLSHLEAKHEHRVRSEASQHGTKVVAGVSRKSAYRSPPSSSPMSPARK